jgi:hypothetical protein
MVRFNDPRFLAFSVENGFLKGDEDEMEAYLFLGRLLHDDVVREKKRASAAAGRGCPDVMDVLMAMSPEEFSAIRKRVARALWFDDRARSSK